MSYILDALKKSDQQRRRGATPTLLAPQISSLPPATRRISMPHLVLAAILIGGGILIGALRPWQTEQAAQAPKLVAMQPLVKSYPRQSPAPVRPQASLKVEQDVTAVKETVSAAPPVPVPVAVKPETAIPVDAAQEPKVMSMAELPAAIQQEIPKMSITVHAYSRAAKDRLLGINDHMLREGDSLAPGLILEQITPDGMIMSYKGYRFRHGAR